MVSDWTEMSGLRNENKARRREAILDAAISLLDERDSSDITAEEIAAVAGVSPATTYNLIGTRDDLILAAGARVIEHLGDAVALVDPADPIAAATLVVDLSVEILVAHAGAYRQVIAMARALAMNRGYGVDPATLQIEPMLRAQALGIVRDDLAADALANQIYQSFTGATTLWSVGVLDNAGFASAVRHGLFTVLAAAATDTHRPQFLNQLVTAERTNSGLTG